MNSYRLKSFLLTALFITPFSVVASPVAQALIENMSEQARQLNYHGLFTYERGQQSSSYKIYHKVDKGFEKQRLLFLDGPEMEIINAGHDLSCVHPGSSNIHHRAEIGSAFQFNRNMAAIWQYYSAQLIGEERLAGRQAIRIDLSPLDESRYPYVFYVDKKTGLMLKMLILDHQKTPLERFHYVDISYGQVSDADLQPTVAHYTQIKHGDKPAAIKTAASKLVLSWVPRGFKRETMPMHPWTTKQTPSKRANMHSYMYSDGLSSFSVFIESIDSLQLSDTRGLRKRMGSTSAISHVYQDRHQAYMVTVIGEIPMMTANQIALAVRAKT